MSAVLICRDALEDSVLGNLALARSFAAAGEETTVVFTGEALAALDTGSFSWSPNFRTRQARAGVIAAAEENDLPLAHPDLDARWSDVRSLVRKMAGQQGIRLVACPVWSRLLGTSPELEHLERVGEDGLVALLRDADTIVGGY